MAALAALLLASTPAAPAQAAVAAALALPGARAEVRGVSITSGARCAPERAVAMRPVAVSGDVPLRLEGRDAAGEPCVAHGWAKVRVVAPALVAARAIRSGEPLADAVRTAEVEIAAGRPALAELPEGAIAARALRPGEPVVAAAVREGPEPGTPVAVLVRVGDVEVTQTGRAIACGRGRACAVLPGGRRVEGRREGSAIVVEAP